MARAPKSADPVGDTADTADAAPDSDSGDSGGDSVLVTICQGADGGYIVYAGDEPDGGDDDGESADDAAVGGAGAADGADAGAGAGGGAGAGAAGAAGLGATGGLGGASGAASAGQPVSSIGAALKVALDILNEDASSAGAAGSSADQFAAGYGADQAPTPTAARPSRGLKYPPAAGA